MTDRPLTHGVDYYLDPSGLMVFTAAYHLRRGRCCCGGCRHCPYGFRRAERREDRAPDPKGCGDMRDER